MCCALLRSRLDRHSRFVSRLRSAPAAQRSLRGLNHTHNVHGRPRSAVGRLTRADALQKMRRLDVQGFGRVESRTENVTRTVGELEFAERRRLSIYAAIKDLYFLDR